MRAFANQQTFTIGRSPDCDVVLADDSVSRRHAELLVLDGGQLFLVDCRSTHGTRLTEHGTTRPVSQEFVSPEAVLHFGDVALPLSEVVDAIRTRHPQAALPRLVKATEPPRKRGRTWAEGTHLVRCRCGVVKPKAERCPECGE